MTPEVYTYYDAESALRDVARDYGGSRSTLLRRAIQRAYHRFMAEHEWSWLKANGRLKLQACQTTGTVAYDATGGSTCERQLTLSGTTWPSDVQDWAIKFDDVVCEIEKRYSDTVVQLDATMCPVADVDSGTTYTAFQRWYALPNDFVSMETPMEESGTILGRYVTPEKMEEMMRYDFTTGDVYFWTIRSAPGLLGTYALFIHGVPTAAETLDFVYWRRPSPLRYSGYASADYEGNITVTAGSATVEGESTLFDTVNNPGAVMLISSSGNSPTGYEGDYPYAEKRTIRSVASTTSLTLDGNVVTSRENTGYRITSPLDMPADVYHAFLACCEAEYARACRLKERGDLERAYHGALWAAKGVDGSRVSQPRFVRGARRRGYGRLSDSSLRDTT